MANKKKARSAKKKVAKQAQAQEADRSRARFTPAAIRQFVQEVQAEFKKIVWPDKKVTSGLTGFVIILTILISLYLGSVDLLLGKLVTLVLQ